MKIQHLAILTLIVLLFINLAIDVLLFMKLHGTDYRVMINEAAMLENISCIAQMQNDHDDHSHVEIMVWDNKAEEAILYPDSYIIHD